jgi:hypothetical protein
MDGMSPQQCAQVAIQKIITLALETKAPHESMQCKWQLTFKWQKVIQDIFDIHKWSLDGPSGETFETAKYARKDLDFVLSRLKLSTFTRKMKIEVLGRELQANAWIFDKALIDLGLKTEDARGADLASKLRTDWDAAMDAITGCGNSLAVPVFT